MPDTLIQTFKARFETLRGTVHLVSDWAAAAETILSILRATAAKRIALATLPEALRETLLDACSGEDIEVLKPPYAHETLPEAIDGADVGVTEAIFAIAQSGTLVEVALDDAERLVSALPKVHIGLVAAAEFVPLLQDAAPRLRSCFQEHDRNCVVSFISGPSRTGDIEMILTLGVHGPGEAHAIVVGTAEEIDHG